MTKLPLQVWVRGRVHQVRGKGGSAFMVLRQDGAYTVQALHFKDKENPDVSKRYWCICTGMVCV